MLEREQSRLKISRSNTHLLSFYVSKLTTTVIDLSISTLFSQFKNNPTVQQSLTSAVQWVT